MQMQNFVELWAFWKIGRGLMWTSNSLPLRPSSCFNLLQTAREMDKTVRRPTLSLISS